MPSMSNSLHRLRSDNERRRLIFEAIEDPEFDKHYDLADLDEDEADVVDLY